MEKPWLKVKDPREKWVSIIPLIGIAVGLGIATFLVWDGLRSVVNHKYCLVYSDDFTGSSTLNKSIWTKEAELGGFGNGQFEETTVTDENVFIRDGVLVIKPTLQDERLITHNSIINLTAQGICTSTLPSDCVTATNTTNGTIVPPVKSGRINTRHGPAVIKYGRVEVTARLPRGDWLWPAIWLLPVNSTYGAWPSSGEIDIAESRGNNWTYQPLGGNDIMSSALHWGPTASTDAWWRTFSKRSALHATFESKFHTFGLEWSERYLFTYLDSRLAQVLYVDFNRPLWTRGSFPPALPNGTALTDPWSWTGRDNTPFDTAFYLLINLAVGGTNGWFQDGLAGKPWVDESPVDVARRSFWDARHSWLPTWDGGEELWVKEIKVWQQAGYRGCLLE